MSDQKPKSTSFAGVLGRLMIPAAILVAGYCGYAQLAGVVEKEPPPPAEKAKLRTRVVELAAGDYPVVITTNAVVQPHNRVTLAAEVPGVIKRVSPSFEVGAFFEEGEVLVEIDPRTYESALAVAEARLSAAESALELAELNEERKLRLIKSNAVSQAEVDGASATREQAEADVDLAGAQLEQARLDLQRTRVVAPFDGRVETKQIGLGQMAGANTPLGDVFAVDFVEVRLPISGAQRRHLDLPERDGDPTIRVTLRDAIVDSSSASWEGRIVRTEGVLDVDSRDVFAIARVEDPFGRESGLPPLRIGQPVIAEIEARTLRGVVALPRRGVRRLDQIVLVDPQEHTLLPMGVEPVWSDAEHVIVRAESLPAGMWLSTTSLTFAPEGTEVEIIPDADLGAAIADSGADDPAAAVAN